MKGKPDGERYKFANRPEFRREVQFDPGHTIRRTRGDGQDYGIHGMSIRFLLHGPKATTQFLLFTGIIPEKVPNERGYLRYAPSDPMGADLGYHADAPQYEDQQSMDCDIRGHGICYYDGSSLRADPVFDTLLVDGGDAVWEILQQEYDGHDFASDKPIVLTQVIKEIEG